MNIKQSTLAAAVTAALVLGVSGQAAASVYASSSLHIDNLIIGIGTFNPTTGAFTPGGATVDSFSYNLTNTAFLNGVGGATNAVCSGTPSSNGCGTTTPVLDALAYNAPGSTVVRTNNQTSGDGSLTWFPIGGGDWSNADSVIYTSQLTGDPSTHTDQIAQSNIDNATSGSANAEIKSATGFTFTFTVNDVSALFLNFDADVDMVAQILNDLGSSFTSEANTNVSFSLTQNTGGNGFANWNPQGTAVNDCAAVGGLTCTETADSQDLNINVGTTTNNTTASHSPGANILGLFPYGINITGLTAGTWTLSLNALTSTLVTRVPEPGVLALLGIGLLGLGMSARRKKLV